MRESFYFKEVWGRRVAFGMKSPFSQSEPIGNRVLASLQDGEMEKLSPHLEAVALEPQQVLYPLGGPVESVYFPESAVVSMFVTMEDGSTTEVGMVGRSGMTGLRVVLGSPQMPHESVVLVGGSAWRMSAEELRRACSSCASLNAAILRFAQALLAQSQQLIACTRLHPLEARLCRWLLMIDDRADARAFPMTHEFISQMMGVRREGVTLALGRLQQAQLLKNSRGVVEIVDRNAMLDAACECYHVIREGYATSF